MSWQGLKQLDLDPSGAGESMQEAGKGTGGKVLHSLARGLGSEEAGSRDLQL